MPDTGANLGPPPQPASQRSGPAEATKRARATRFMGRSLCSCLAMRRTFLTCRCMAHLFMGFSRNNHTFENVSHRESLIELGAFAAGHRGHVAQESHIDA